MSWILPKSLQIDILNQIALRPNRGKSMDGVHLTKESNCTESLESTSVVSGVVTPIYVSAGDIPPGVSPVKPVGATDNKKWYQVLFSVYKAHTAEGNPTKCRDIRNSIKQKEILDLPNFKVDDRPRCPAWHIKGMCNPTGL